MRIKWFRMTSRSKRDIDELFREKSDSEDNIGLTLDKTGDDATDDTQRSIMSSNNEQGVIQKSVAPEDNTYNNSDAVSMTITPCLLYRRI